MTATLAQLRGLQDPNFLEIDNPAGVGFCPRRPPLVVNR
jgi:hypothetical protein